jgi:HEAT repeat protein
MTRRIAKTATDVLLSAAFAAEVGAGVLALRYSVRRLSAGGATTIAVVVAVVGCAALTLWAMTAGRILIAAFRSVRRDRNEHDRIVWSDRWIDIVFGEAEAPHGPLPKAAVDSLLDLRESLVGEPAEMVGSLMRDYGVETGLIEQLEQSRATSKTVIKPSRALDRRLEVLDDLGRAQTPRAVPTLLRIAADPEPAARLAGIRALARSVAAIPTESERRAVAPEVLRVLQDAELSMGALSEAMELLGPAAQHVVGPILERPQRYGNRMLTAAIDTVGHLRMEEFSGDVARFASSKRTSIRLAAIHALTKVDRLPPSAAPSIQSAFRDRNASIRIEAARAAKLLETKTAIYHLEELLCDDDWTVRRVAATTLAGLGGPGIRTLIATSLVHGDHRARSIATQVLMESRSAAELEAEPEKVG